MPLPTHTPVLVLGAGFAGLAAARRLRERGIDVHLVEARERVGGRTHTRYLAGDLQIDLGGQWLGPTQTRMYELAEAYGVATFPLAEEGAAFARHHGVDHDAPGDDADALYEQIDVLADTVDLDDPARTPQAAVLDKQTLYSWLAERADDQTAAYVARTLAGGLLGKDAGEVSMLQLLFYVKSGSGVDSLLSTRGGAQQDRLVGGPFALAEKLAAELGERVTLGFAVARLAHDGERWSVTSRDGRTVTADRVVTAIPTPLLRTIEISPAPSMAKRRAILSLTTGASWKFHAVYPAPLWREAGRSAVYNSAEGLITEAVDNSMPGDARGVLTFFCYGEDSLALADLDPAERRRVLLAELAERFDDPRLADAEEFVDFSWDDEPFTGGCFSSSFTVGTMHRYAAALREPWLGLHFAGTETAEIWNGYFEGAVRSGEREADRIVADLA